MAYERYEQALITEFGNDIENGRVLLENKDLANGKERNKYNQYIASISKLNPQEYNITSFPILGIDKVLEIAGAIILTIYGEEVLPVLEEYLSVLNQSDTLSALDGISISMLHKETFEEIKIVEVPSLEYSSTITTIVHEFTHFLLRKYKVDFSKKSYYEEILSIYAEKIENLYITRELGLQGSKFHRQIEECRLEGINWHYNINLPLLEQNVALYNKLKQKRDKTLSDLRALASMEQTIPQVRTSKGQSILRGYYKNMADSYGIGYLYGSSLVEKHLDDLYTMKAQIRKVLNGILPFQEFLNYYGINARNYQVYDAVERQLDIVRKSR